jgi:protein O-mannosyl-transferase
VNLTSRRLYLAVVLCAVVPHIPAVWNGFAMDDLYIIAWNPLVHGIRGVWGAFAGPYWPPDFGGFMYRPLPLASFALDWSLVRGHAWWFHAMNIAWHAGVTLAVTALALRWADLTVAVVAGLIFAVHPVHVEAIANVVGRAELMAAAGVCLAVYAAVVRRHVVWSALALLVGLLSKENAIVAPALIVLAWGLGLGASRDAAPARPSRRTMLLFAASWVVTIGVYVAVRSIVLHPYARNNAIAPVFLGEGFLAGRLTALAALSDIAFLLLAPLTLRVDYSPAERTLVHSLLDGRLAAGLLCLAAWTILFVLAWRRGRRLEAFGLGWIGIAFLPVANLVFPTGVLVAERTLYLPSVGLALAAGAALARLRVERLRGVVVLLVLAGGIRSVLRVPVWHDDLAVTLSILEDSPNSFRGPQRMAVHYLSRRQPERSLAAVRIAARTFDRDPAIFITGADAAFTVKQYRAADSMLVRLEQLCYRCAGYYRVQGLAARSRGDSATADSLLARMP